MENAYNIEVDEPGCECCEAGRMYHVVGPDDMASSRSYEDIDEAEYEARILNRAYVLGRMSVSSGLRALMFEDYMAVVGPKAFIDD